MYIVHMIHICTVQHCNNFVERSLIQALFASSFGRAREATALFRQSVSHRRQFSPRLIDNAFTFHNHWQFDNN